MCVVSLPVTLEQLPGCGSVYFRCSGCHFRVYQSTSGFSWRCHLVFRSWRGISGGIGASSGPLGGLPATLEDFRTIEVYFLFLTL